MRLTPPAPRTGGGFSLIEAAIVLGIIGLVIGGIWVAAAALNTQRFNQDALRAVSFSMSIFQKQREQWEDWAGGQVTIGDMVALGSGLPPDYAYHAANTCVGLAGFCLDVRVDSGGGVTSLSMTSLFIGRPWHIGTAASKGFRINQRLCVELSNFFLRQTFSRPNAGIMWNRVVPFGTMGAWDALVDPVPDFSTISAYCTNTRSISVWGLVP